MIVFKTLILLVAFFASTTRGVNINCLFLHIIWPTVGVMYTCRVDVIDISENDSELRNVTGPHRDTNTDKDVTAIAFDPYNTMKQIPRNIENNFPNLMVLSCNSGELTSVSADQLKPFPNMRLVDFRSNKITVIDGDLFKYTPNIQVIWLARNHISSVGQNLFSGLTQLSYATFRGNTFN